jgi:GGDEF domain-containing protein
MGSTPWLVLLAVALLADAALAVMLRRRGRQVRVLERERARLAGLDPVTQVAGRGAFALALEDALAGIGDPTRGRRTGDATGDLALIVLAVDASGDGVLRAVARVLGETVRPVDLLARTGASEFAVIAPGAGSAGARRLAEALLECAEDRRLAAGRGAGRRPPRARALVPRPAGP